MTIFERLTALAAHSPLFASYTGPFTEQDLEDLLTAEFGDQRHQFSAPQTILHIVSSNTPHAAFQSLLRGLILGSHNRIKLPSAGLPEFEKAIQQLPPSLSALLETAHDLPADWLAEAEVLVIYGTDETIRTLREMAPNHTRIIAHGPRLSIGLVRNDPDTAARLAAIDICRFDQRGCLSVHAVYLHPDCPISPPAFAALLAEAMARDVQTHPPTGLTPSEAGAITTLRETARFMASSQVNDYQLWESPDSTDWTVLYESSPILKVSCLNRTAYVKPWPEDLSELGPEIRQLACLALHPYDPPLAEDHPPLRPSRICPLGQTQHPPLTWHQDGLPPLASLTGDNKDPQKQASP